MSVNVGEKAIFSELLHWETAKLTGKEHSMFNFFLVNALMLIGLISIAFLTYHTGRDSFMKHRKLASVLFGIYAGVAGAILMNQSFETSSGVLVGYRNYNVGLIALIGGIIPTSITAIIMFINRVIVIGLTKTTFTLFFSLLTLTIGSALIKKYVQKFLYQWISFCVLNVAVISAAFYFLGQFQSNPYSMFVYFYIGHVFLSFIIYFIMKFFLLFSRTYNKLAEESTLNTHDPLTGLLNRNALRLRKKDLSESESLSGKWSVITIDIDNFRMVNDAFGQRFGDQMIIDMSQKIISYVGDCGDVYHTDGDEFVIVLESTASERIQELAKQILHNLAKQIMITGRLYFLTASIGVCIGIEGEPLDQTIENADVALYLAKKNKNSVKLYTQEMEKARTRDAVLEDDLRCALDRGQLELYYQPIYDVRKGVINQAEALLRWNHPEFGRVSPVEFIPIAERTKLILPITDWVIQQACQQLAEWKALGIDGILVSVNLTFISFENRGDELTAYIVNAIKETGISPSNLKLEITESTLMHDSDEIIKVFHDLKRIGVKLALDDFGTGYSSFGYMKDLPLDIMKLDRSLISDIVMSEKEQMIVSTMITIIHGLGLEVVVEGVEEMAQYEILKQFNCDYIQGFLFSRPLPAEEFVEYYRFTKDRPHTADYLKQPKI